MKILNSFFVSAVLLLGTSGAVATPVDLRIDLGTGLGATPGNWNNIGGLDGTTSGLVDFGSGSATSASLTLAGWNDFVGDVTGAFPNTAWLIQPATQDGVGIQQASTGTLTFSGLTGSSYRLEVVSARTTFNYLNTFTANGALADSTELGTSVVTPWNSNTDGLADGNWLIWSNIPAVGGSITLTDVTTSTLGIVNAIRLVGDVGAPQVPEPISISLFGVGLLGFGFARRRAAKR